MLHNLYKKKILILLFLFINIITSLPMAFPNDVVETSIMKDEITSLLEDKENNIELNNQFQSLLVDLFSNRNSAILSHDSEGLKTYYDLNKKVGLWAYENELKKIDYFSNWSEKQGTKFNKINSIIQVKKVKEHDSNIFGVICSVSTDFHYSYIDEPTVDNCFRLGTDHYLNLQKTNDNYIITKEWYTDPLADSLDLENIKSDEIKGYILNQSCPNLNLDNRTIKAIEYAHKYCGICDDSDFMFKYNPNYKNFNYEGGDCANFASQILYEGGGFKKNGIWNYNSGSATKSWINAQAFKNYLVNSGRGSYIAKGNYQETYKDAFKLRPGDIVAYEKKGRITHISTVTALDSKGYPLVTCHNTDRLRVPYDLGWSNSNIKFHLIDVYY